MIAAHGATITVTNSAIRITPTELAASLHGSGDDVVIEVAAVQAVSVEPGDGWDPARVTIETAPTPVTVTFAPGARAGADELVAAIEAAQAGNAPSEEVLRTGVPGLDFVGFDVETANGNWGSICQIGLVKVIDGLETDRASWLCQPPVGLDEFDSFNVAIHGITADDVADAPRFAELVDKFTEFLGELPVVAHNAQFDATALFQACDVSNVAVPPVAFACTLAQSRAARLPVENHKLPTLAKHFGVSLNKHHDACADATACAGIMVELARQAGHTGSLMDYVHATGFTLGIVDSTRVTPVLRDRSGASRAMQAKHFAQVAAGAAPDKVFAAAAPEVSGAGTDQPVRRGPAPWQSVATPDTIPEPNPDADPAHRLFGQNVVLTGEFEPFDKGTLWAGIASAGGQVAKNVTKKTTIVVTGAWATMTSKEKRARELQDKGQEIAIWPAEKLLDELGLNEQPPF